MNEKHAIAFFVAQSIQRAQSLPIGKARGFLKGLPIVGDSRPELDPLRDLYRDLCALDEQLTTLQLHFVLEEAKS